MDDSGINNYAEAPRQSAGKIWEISAIVFGVALAVGLVLWLIGLVHFGRVKLDESQSYEIVCDADIVNHLNAVGFPGLEGNTREWQRVIDQLSEHSGWDGDPTCAAISFLNSQYNQDIDGMKAALDKIKITPKAADFSMTDWTVCRQLVHCRILSAG